MATLTDKAVAGLIKAQGYPAGTSIAEWVALARRESGFRTDIQDYAGSDHWGLWQISANHYNMKGMAFTGGKDAFRQNLKDPAYNWYAARVVYSNQGWGAWVASHSPTAADRTAAGDPQEPTDVGIGDILGNAGDLAPDPISGIFDVLKTVTDPIRAASEWLGNPGNWVRVIQVVGGISLGLVAAAIVARPIVEDVAKTVGKP